MTRQTYTNEATGAVERWSATKQDDGTYQVIRAVWEAAPINDWEPPSSHDFFVARVGLDHAGAVVVQLDAPLRFEPLVELDVDEDEVTHTQMARGRVAVKREIRAQARASREDACSRQ